MPIDDQSALNLDPYEEDSQLTEPSNEGDNNEQPVVDSNQNTQEDDIISELLTANGIVDSSKIKFEDDTGQIVERNWKDLTKEEKVNILRANQPTMEFSPEETEFIWQIRNSQGSPSDFLNALVEQAVSERTPAPRYQVEDISDDELFVLDTLSKLGEENVTDDQLERLLTNAKSDPELYQKTIESLREQYKQQEDELELYEQQQYKARQEQQYDRFSDSILNEIESLAEMGGQKIELSVDDKNELADYILTRDDNGDSDFDLVIRDPKMFVQVALWALKGNDILREINDQVKTAYNNGLRDGKKGQSPLVINPSKKDNVTHRITGDDANYLDVQ